MPYKPDQLRKAADIIENGFSWQVKTDHHTEWMDIPDAEKKFGTLGDPIRALQLGLDIRIVNAMVFTRDCGPQHERWVPKFRPGDPVLTPGGIRHIVASVDHMQERYCLKSLQDIAMSEKDLTPAPPWKLPDPPEGSEWCRGPGLVWLEEDLPDNKRPLLIGEKRVEGVDEIWGRGKERGSSKEWSTFNSNSGRGHDSAGFTSKPTRTSRPLPAPIEFVPLAPSDIPDFSIFRNPLWAPDCYMTGSITPLGVYGIYNGMTFASWKALMDEGWTMKKALAVGRTSWKPCKKKKTP